VIFHIKDFKTISTIGPVLENLYNLQVLDGLGQQELISKDARMRFH
jgi:hypothetical protein